MSKVVFDTSALLAMINAEPGGERAWNLMTRDGAEPMMSAVNFSEAQGRLVSRGADESEAWRLLSGFGLEVVAFDAAQARTTGSLIAVTSRLGLSLGDRACLSLGMRERCKVVTADRAWALLELDVEVELVRG